MVVYKACKKKLEEGIRMKRSIALMVILLAMLIQVPASAANHGYAVAGTDRVNFFGNMKVDDEISGNVISLGGNVDIGADVNGDIIVLMGNLSLDAEVSGDVVMLLGKATLSDRSKILGDMVAVGSVERTPGSYVQGENILLRSGFIDMNGFDMNSALMFRYVFLFMSLIFLLVFGIPTIYFISNRFMNIEVGIEYEIGKKLVIGCLGLIGSAIITVLLCWTLIVPLAFALFIFLSKIVAYLYIGKMIMKTSKARMNMYIEFITGVIAIVLVKFILLVLIPQSYFFLAMISTVILNFVINSLGVGILVVSRFGENVI